jgi:antitoxin component YwqK of YwqJK toxin-antitoxin module
LVCALGLAAVLAGTVFLVFRPARTGPVTEAKRQTLTLRDGRLYRPGDAAPFSGVVTEFYANGVPLSRSSVANGLLEGLSEGWHTNGRIQVREQFTAGVSHGQRIKWHANGQKLSEATIVRGKMEGLFRRWHEDGALAEEIPMKAGQPDGLARSYFPSGFLKAEARLRDGQVIEQHFWNDGEHKGPTLAQNSNVRSANHVP